MKKCNFCTILLYFSISVFLFVLYRERETERKMIIVPYKNFMFLISPFSYFLGHTNCIFSHSVSFFKIMATFIFNLLPFFSALLRLNKICILRFGLVDSNNIYLRQKKIFKTSFSIINNRFNFCVCRNFVDVFYYEKNWIRILVLKLSGR